MEPMHDPRFWERVTTSDGHRLWTGALNSDGYGHLRRRGRLEKAHRWAWQLTTGETLTPAETICHACDIRNCVETNGIGVYEVDGNTYPRRGHLFKATQPANVGDRDRKGRGRWAKGDQHGTHTHPESLHRGQDHANAKLTDAEATDIRRRYSPRYGVAIALAREYGVSASTIARIGRQQSHRHLG
jgi:hypothetical protein